MHHFAGTFEVLNQPSNVEAHVRNAHAYNYRENDRYCCNLKYTPYSVKHIFKEENWTYWPTMYVT